MPNRRSEFYYMYTILPESHGVYALYNTLEDKYYVGFCLNYKGGMRWRCRDHLYALRANKHTCSKLQESWNKDNTCWKFICLELTIDSDKELYWMDKLNSINNGYNIKHKGINDNKGENNPMYGKHHSIESRLKISNTKRGIIC